MINALFLLDPKTDIPEDKKALSHGNVNKLLKGRQKILNDFESKKFLIRITTNGKGPKLLIPKQILQQLPIAGNISEKLLN